MIAKWNFLLTRESKLRIFFSLQIKTSLEVYFRLYLYSSVYNTHDQFIESIEHNGNNSWNRPLWKLSDWEQTLSFLTYCPCCLHINAIGMINSSSCGSLKVLNKISYNRIAIFLGRQGQRSIMILQVTLDHDVYQLISAEKVAPTS